MHFEEITSSLYSILGTPPYLYPNAEVMKSFPEEAQKEIRDYLAGPLRPVGFVSLVGSHNYEVNDETSDVDFKATYIPAIEDFYFNRFPKFSVVTPTFDCALTPLHEYRRHMLKGNINFFEPLFAKSIAVNPDLEQFWDIMRMLVKMNVYSTVMACMGTAHEKHKVVMRSIEYRLMAGEYKPKDAAAAIRILHFVETLVRTGEFNLVPATPIKDMVRLLRSGEMTREDFLEVYADYNSEVCKLAFADYETKAPSDAVKDLDRSETPEFSELQQLADAEVLNSIRESVY